ncbi:MAG: hypothetical protein ACYTGB_08565 [Planctomycetota bacterium]
MRRALPVFLGLLLLSAACGCGVVDDSPPPVWREDPPGKAGAIDLSRAGTYICGRWKYVLSVRDREYAREVLQGSLFYDGRSVAPRAGSLTRSTPWGEMRFEGYGVRSRFRGWVPAGASR